MPSPLFSGVCPALVTPFDTNGAVDYERFSALIETQLSAQVAALCVCGTTGEASTLSAREQFSLVHFCATEARGRVPVIAGCGSNDTARAAYLARRCEEAGADALLVVTPYYNKATPSGLLQHYTHVAAHTGLPIILYNVPSRTGVSLTAELYAALHENQQIIGIKEASGSVALVSHTRALCGEDFSIWSGNDDQVLPLVALGAQGVISVMANVAPEAMVALTAACLSGDFAEARALHTAYLPLMDALFLEVNPIPVKATLALLGCGVGGLRLPLCLPTADTLQKLRAALAQINLGAAL